MPSNVVYKPSEKINPNIPLTPDLISQNQKQFEKTSVVVGDGTENGNTNIYTVPAHKKFILQGLVFQNADSVGGGQGYLTIGGVDVFGILGVANTNPLISLTFPSPLPYPSGTIFNLRSEAAGCIVYATIYGYLTDF